MHAAGAQVGAALLLGTLAAAALGQSFAGRPVRLILGVAPGGGQDTVARAMAPRLSRELGANIVVDNRPGAGGAIGASLAKQASPDGHTLFMMSLSNVIGPILHGAAYDVRKDFVPVAQLVRQPYLLVVPPALPVRTVRELIHYAKENSGKVSFGSAGTGSLTHLAGEFFREQSQFNATHVPYKGMGAVYPDLIGGRIEFAFSTIVSAQPHARANRLRVLAVSSDRRVKSAPDVPTVAEAGIVGFAVSQLYGVLAPAGSARPMIDVLSKAFVVSIEDPQLSKHLEGDGAEADGAGPREFAAQLSAEYARWERVVSRSGLRGAK